MSLYAPFTSTKTTCTITGVKNKATTDIIVPTYVTNINQGILNGCSSLQNLTLPFIGNRKNVASTDTYQYPLGYIFGTSYYTGSTSTKQYYYGAYETNTIFYIPNSLKNIFILGGYIPFGAFYNCNTITNIKLESATEIGQHAFYNCKLLSDITIPEGVRKIGTRAFEGCEMISHIAIPNSITYIGFNAFANCNNLQYNEYKNAFYLGNTSCHYIALIKAVDSTVNSIEIADSTKIIYQRAFSGCNNLTSLSIPENVTNIGNDILFGCSSLARLSIPFIGIQTGITSKDIYQYPLGYFFGTEHFSGSTQIYQEYYDYSNSSLFGHYYYIPSTLESVTILSSYIPHGALHNCSMLTNISLGNTVSGIGDKAFYNCSHLISITFEGTTLEWNSIQKGSDWDYRTASYVIHCSDQDIEK